MSNTSTAVIARRYEERDTLDLFCTPTEGTEALYTFLTKKHDLSNTTALDPCAGLGHMSEPMQKYHKRVYTADIEQRTYPLDFVADFTNDILNYDIKPDWIVMNPPFNQGNKFIFKALTLAEKGVCIFGRLALMESIARYPMWKTVEKNLTVLVFSKRVHCFRPGLDKPSGAMQYAWYVIDKGFDQGTKLEWIPPS